LGGVTQGSSCRATLGFETLSFQDMKPTWAEDYRWEISEKIQQEETESAEGRGKGTLLRANGAADSDLTRSLSYGNEHDIHDPDSSCE